MLTGDNSYFGSFAVSRTGNITYNNGWYQGTYTETIDPTSSFVTRYEQEFAWLDGLGVNLGESTRYSDVFGLTLAELLRDGDKILGSIANDIISTTDRAEIIDLRAGLDIVDARGGNDTILGGEGTDYITGGAGDDSMSGGADTDFYAVDSALDVVVEDASGGSNDTVTSTATYALSDHVESLSLAGAAIGGTGNNQSNSIGGNSVANVLAGLDGNDTIDGGFGDDTIDGGAGADSLTGGEGDDSLTGGSDGDTLSGGLGTDTMDGGLGDDAFIVDASGDLVVEALDGGYDTVTSSANYILAVSIEKLVMTGAAVQGAGNAGANSIFGNELANKLSGLAGADTIIGGNGADSLLGGKAKDVLTGGAQKDFFVYATAKDTGKNATKRDVITDFKHNKDKIDLSGIDAKKGFKANDKFVFEGTDAFSKTAGELHWFKQGSGSTKVTIVEADIDGNGKADFQIELSGHIKLTASDFIL